MESYLTNRKQSVVIYSLESDMVQVISGVPQGSVLGPLLFLIYVNDIYNITLSCENKITMYGDDLVLYKVIDMEFEFVSIQEDIDKIAQWTNKNCLTLNKAKCKAVLLTHRYSIMPPIFLQGEQIEQVYTYKYIDLTITPTLNGMNILKNIFKSPKNSRLSI